MEKSFLYKEKSDGKIKGVGKKIVKSRKDGVTDRWNICFKHGIKYFIEFSIKD